MRKTLSICMLILFSCCYFYAASTATYDPCIVDTKYGKVKGSCSESVRVFKSIPYAGSVSGKNRWTESRPPRRWAPNILDGTVDPPACPQNNISRFYPKVQQHEDCLYLNVFTPHDATPDSHLPVLVFIHGGAFIFGYSADPRFDGSYLASHSKIIVVTINYRLGALGFLVFDTDIKGNFGIKDQRLALQWVKYNIHSFGGNPNKVTLSGQSAGAMSVAIHMTSSKSYGLFHQAIIESDPFGMDYRTEKREWNSHSKEFADKLGCCKWSWFRRHCNLACLHAKHFSEILRYQDSKLLLLLSYLKFPNVWELPWAPVIDGNELTDQPLRLFQHGQFKHVPTIMGTTSAEGTLFVYKSFREEVKGLKYAFILSILFGIQHSTEAIRDNLFHSKGFLSDHRPQLSEAVMDYGFYCATILAAKSVLNSAVPVYNYIFNHPFPGKSHTVCENYACHGAELPYVFHTYEDLYTKQEEELANNVSEYWGNFVNTGNPNLPCGGDECTKVEWPRFNGWTSLMMSVPVSQVKWEYHKSYCDVINKWYDSDRFTARGLSAGFTEVIGFIQT